nr:hypothetical protein [uncultured Psychroserpens sp.]
MKYLSLFIITLVFFSCGNERILQLPEIENATITEIHDVSHAYLFYDETKEDSVELNRKNLISTTNWLVNVDKRLTLEQAIPKIKFLQDKKRNAKMHKNEAAKNYYTCNDKSIQNLGFLEFTDVAYHFTTINSIKDSRENNSVKLHIDFKNADDIYINQKRITKSNLSNDLNEIITLSSNALFYITISVEKTNSFQDYIWLKNTVHSFLNAFVIMNNNEFIY